MRIGKLSIDELNKNIFSVVGSRRREVVDGCTHSGDCSLLDLNGLKVLVSTNAVAVVGESEGYRAVVSTANGIGASGGYPVSANITLLLPTNATMDTVKRIMTSAEEGAKACNLEITGGHTEFTSSVTEPVITCSVVGVLSDDSREDISLRAGNTVIVTKFAGIAGTQILGERYRNELSVLDKDTLSDALSFKKDTSILKECACLAGADVTMLVNASTGGILGALCDVCAKAGLGAEIDGTRIPVHYVTKKLCETLNIDPLKLHAGGSLIITTNKPGAIVALLKKRGITCTEIGVITKGAGVTVKRGERTEKLEFVKDEITRLWEERYV